MNKSEKLLFLKGYRKKAEILNDLWLKYNALVSAMENCKAIEYTDMPKSSKSSDLSDKMVRKEELVERINRWTEKTNSMRKLISEEIDKYIEDLLINDAMHQYWVESASKQDVANTITIKKSVRQVDRYLADGLKLILND